MSRSSEEAQTLHSVLDELTRHPGEELGSLTVGVSSEAKSIDKVRLTALAERCAPTTPSSVILAIVAVESAGRPLLLSQNRPDREVFAPHSQPEAVDRLDTLIVSGSNVDVGLMQINSATLQRLHVLPQEALDPCRNLALGARIFDEGYAAAFARHQPTPLLMSAYSTYNTGAPDRGFANGYVDKVEDRLRRLRLSAGG